jgi:hypothetical protein
MSFIAIKMHNGPEYAIIITDQDGNSLVFDNREDAEAETADCQNGFVLESKRRTQCLN